MGVDVAPLSVDGQVVAAESQCLARHEGISMSMSMSSESEREWAMDDDEVPVAEEDGSMSAMTVAGSEVGLHEMPIE